MPNYELKAKVIQSGLVTTYKQVKRAINGQYAEIAYGLKNTSKMGLDTALERQFFYSQNSPDEWQEARRVANSNFKQIDRLKHRIKKICDTSKNPVFVTLTFDDNSLQDTSPETRRKYVSRFLKEHCSRYVANIDYGSQNGREHYHAVVDDRFNPTEWKCGNCDVKAIRNGSEDKTKLAKYITKLTNHAIKDTTKRCHIIYSRNV